MGLEWKVPAAWRGSQIAGGTGGNVDINFWFYSYLFLFPSLFTRKIIFLLWRVNIYSIDFTDLVTWQKM